VHRGFARFASPRFLWVLAEVLVGLVVGIGVTVAMGLLLKLPELDTVRRALRRKLGRS
jgi:hypothetical protein